MLTLRDKERPATTLPQHKVGNKKITVEDVFSLILPLNRYNVERRVSLIQKLEEINFEHHQNHEGQERTTARAPPLPRST